jgi:hypothetical protein
MKPGSVCRHLKIAGRAIISRFFHVTGSATNLSAFETCNVTDLHCLQVQQRHWLLPIVPMPKWLKFCVALICLICVVAICIAPDVDLPDTVLRANQLGLLLLLAAVAFASLCTGQLLTLTSRPNIGLPPSETAHFGWFLPEPGRNCVFLC